MSYHLAYKDIGCNLGAHILSHFSGLYYFLWILRALIVSLCLAVVFYFLLIWFHLTRRSFYHQNIECGSFLWICQTFPHYLGWKLRHRGWYFNKNESELALEYPLGYSEPYLYLIRSVISGIFLRLVSFKVLIVIFNIYTLNEFVCLWKKSKDHSSFVKFYFRFETPFTCGTCNITVCV